MKFRSLFFLLALFLISCRSNNDGKYPSEIQTLIDNQQYVQALQSAQMIQTQDRGKGRDLLDNIKKDYESWLELRIAELKIAWENNPTKAEALADIYLQYGIYYEYYAEHVAMKLRMTGALEHLRRAVELDPENDKAKAEIEQIESIYKQMGREIPEGVAE